MPSANAESCKECTEYLVCICSRTKNNMYIHTYISLYVLTVLTSMYSYIPLSKDACGVEINSMTTKEHIVGRVDMLVPAWWEDS